MNTHTKFGSDPPKNLRENRWQPENTFKKSPKMIPKQNHIENSFKLMKHHAEMNTHTKFGSDPPKNLRENWSQQQNR